MADQILVVLVEDNDVFREALELLLGLRPDIRIIASVSDGADAARVAAELCPDVVLMDYRLPGLDGVQATRAVLGACPETAVVCLSAEQTPTTSQPTPGDFLAAYEDLGRFERILSLHIAGKLSGTIESARTAAQMLGDDRVRTIDSESASVAIAMLGLAIQRSLELGTTDEEVDELASRYRRDAGLLFTVDTFEYLVRGGRVGRAGGWGDAAL